MARIPSCCGCGVGRWLQLQLDPSLGTSICRPQKTKKKKKKKKSHQVKFSSLTLSWSSLPTLITLFFGLFFFLVFWRPHPRHMEVPRLGVELVLHYSHSNTRSELRLQPTPQLTASRILNPLSKARDWTYVLMDASQICLGWATAETPIMFINCALCIEHCLKSHSIHW